MPTLSVILITKNEEEDLPGALRSVAWADQIVVVDNNSIDRTRDIAASFGAEVHVTAEWPGFGEQKSRALSYAKGDWVLSLDADEWLTPELQSEVRRIVRFTTPSFAYYLNRRSIFIDRLMRFGDWRKDHILRLFPRGKAHFSGDAIHEKVLTNLPSKVCRGLLMHRSVKSRNDSIEKMWRYNRVAALRLQALNRGGYWTALLHAGFGFFRGLVLRVGFLDGWRGVQLAWINARGTFIRYHLAGQYLAIQAWQSRRQTSIAKALDWLHMMVIDHGLLRLGYQNEFRLPGGLIRVNQPSPANLIRYQKRYGIKTVVNLRGKNEQLGWYRLESDACEQLGIHLLNLQVYSRGLVEKWELLALLQTIRNLEMPALVHCKSGADRAGFFAACYRYIRLGEPAEEASRELGWRYGHFSAAKTGVLDHFFTTYLQERDSRESLLSWANRAFTKERVESSFSPSGVSSWVVDRLLRRE